MRIEDLEKSIMPICGRTWNNPTKKRLAKAYAQTDSIAGAARIMGISRKTISVHLGGLDGIIEDCRRPQLSPPAKAFLFIHCLPDRLRNAGRGDFFIWHTGILEHDRLQWPDVDELAEKMKEAERLSLLSLSVRPIGTYANEYRAIVV